LISAVLFLIVGNLLLGWTSSFILFLAVLIVLNIMKKEIGYVHRLVSKLFLSNLSVTPMEVTQVTDTLKPSIWEAQVSEFVVSPASSVIGMSLEEAQIREKYNVLITAIDRGGRRIYGPARYERIYPGDRLFVFGAEEDIINFRSLIEVGDQNLTPEDLHDSFAVESFDIPDSSILVGQTIRDSFLRNQGGTLIIGIERRGNRILNPDGQMQLSSGDRVWMAGERNELTKKIKELEKLSDPKP
jgi:CPA2 family monovalent cation:H+ antiporter-2